MSIFKWNTLLLVVLSLAFFSCEKEMISTNQQPQTLKIDEQNTLIPHDIALTDVEVNAEDGMLSFPSVSEYQKALQAITNADADSYAKWISDLGVTTYYSAYQTVVDRLEENPDTPVSAQLSAQERAAYTLTDEGVLLPKIHLLDAMLTNRDQRLLVEGDLNIFLTDQHILIDATSREQVDDLLARPLTNSEMGVLVTPYEDVMNARMQNVDLEVFGTSCLSIVYGREDSQRFDGTRFKMISNYQRLPTPVSFDLPNHRLSIVFRTFISYSNWRRNGLWGWRRTFPNTTFDFGLGDPFQDAPRFNSSLTVQLTDPSQFITPHVINDRASTGFFMAAFNMGNTHFGQASGSFLFDNFSVSVSWAPGQTVVNTNFSYAYTDGGTVRAFWSNRGNQNDPLGGRFFCDL